MANTIECEQLEAYERHMILKSMTGELIETDFHHHKELWEAEEATRT